MVATSFGSTSSRPGSPAAPALLLAHLEQLRHLTLGQGLRLAEDLRDEAHPGVHLQYFHAVERLHDVSGHGEGTVVGQEQRVTAADLLFHGAGNLLGGRRAVLRESDPPEAEDDLGQHHLLVEPDAAGGETGCGRRVGVHDARHVGACPVDREVHLHLGGGLAGTGQHSAVGIDLQEVLGSHVALVDAARCHEEGAVVEPGADVAVVGGHEEAIGQPLPRLDHLPPGDSLRPWFPRRHSCRGSGGCQPEPVHSSSCGTVCRT